MEKSPPLQGTPVHPADGQMDLVRMALAEDVGTGDATTLALVPETAQATADILVKASGVVAGTRPATEVFRRLDPGITIKILTKDGSSVNPGDPIMRIKGHARAILTGERTALNFIQRLSGVATLTAAFVNQVKDLSVSILDTRKTTPGWRLLEKQAVQAGGGANHRMGLYDRIMIKDNHLAFWAAQGQRQFATAVRLARSRYPHLLVQVEVDHFDQLDDVLTTSPDWLLLDNMSPVEVRRCVAHWAGRANIEVSGGITLDTIRDYAAAGPDAISIGALTHSATALDCSMEWITQIP